MVVTAPACTNPCCCVNLELNGNRISTLPRATEIISAPIVDMNGCRPKLSRTFFSNASTLSPCHGSLSLLLRKQANPVHAGFASNVNHVRHVFEVNIVVASHKSYSFRTRLEDVVQPTLQILPLYGFLIDLERRRLVLRAPNHL